MQTAHGVWCGDPLRGLRKSSCQGWLAKPSQPIGPSVSSEVGSARRKDISLEGRQILVPWRCGETSRARGGGDAAPLDGHGGRSRAASSRRLLEREQRPARAAWPG